MARVTIYTTSVCPFCAQAKRLLSERAIAYDEVDVGRDEAGRAKMVNKAGGRRTVPQIFIDREHVGGYEELRALAERGRARSLEFAWPRVTDQLEAIYRKIAGRKSESHTAA